MSFPPNPHAERGWTRHGHPIPGAVQVEPHPRRARCGGPVLCRACQGDVAAWEAGREPAFRTPDEWSAIDGVTVRDPDGWRGPEGRPWSEPIGRVEWERRLSLSTVEGGRPGPEPEREGACVMTGAAYVAPVGTRPDEPGWQRLSSATLTGPEPDVQAALSVLRAAEWEVRTDRAHGHLSGGITYTRIVAASSWREASAEPAPVRVVGNPPDVAPLAELNALLAEPEPARLPTGYVSLLAANAREAVDALANAPLLARAHAPQDPLTRAAVEAEHALRSLYVLALDRLRSSDAETARPAPDARGGAAVGYWQPARAANHTERLSGVLPDPDRKRGFGVHVPIVPPRPALYAQGEAVGAEERDEPTPGAPLECTCRTCESGALTAGHCVDADDAPWHACRATRAVYGVGETPDDNPGGA